MGGFHPSHALTRLLDKEGTGISWADLTFNPWIGCQKVGPACDHCYAETLDNRWYARKGEPPHWGPGAPRKRTSPANWAKPRRWNRVAAAAGAVLNVFCASLADWADNAIDPAWRLDLADLIRSTPSLRWMMLTKRIGNAEPMLRAMFPEGVPENVALGITVANQAEADRDIPKAAEIKERLGIARLFLSIEPMLGLIDLSALLWHPCPNSLDGLMMDPSTGAYECCSRCDFTGIGDELAVDLVICGGESGAGARPVNPNWARRLRDDCATAGVGFHFKQWGEWLSIDGWYENYSRSLPLRAWDGRRWRDDDGGLSGPWVARIGVEKAGRLLDGKEYLAVLA